MFVARKAPSIQILRTKILGKLYGLKAGIIHHWSNPKSQYWTQEWNHLLKKNAGQIPGTTPAIPGMFPNMFPSLASGQFGALPVMSVQATRHARRVYVGGLPPTANEQSVATFFSHVMSAIGGNTAGPAATAAAVETTASTTGCAVSLHVG